MLEVLLVIALVLAAASAWWGGLRFGPIGLLPAAFSVLLILIMYYDGRLHVH